MSGWDATRQGNFGAWLFGILQDEVGEKHFAAFAGAVSRYAERVDPKRGPYLTWLAWLCYAAKPYQAEEAVREGRREVEKRKAEDHEGMQPDEQGPRNAG